MVEYLIEICFSPTRYRLHRDDCPILPKVMVRDYFGLFKSDTEAVSHFNSVMASHSVCSACLGGHARRRFGK